ncbi:phosphopantetheine-binding protein [Lawsonibacter celer]|uniref:phosphopantetheine-binding protein n=1 Tax=Lawsonibacter celer TaxID=2986526 RepID=UPI001649627E|nr:phosphopantetheine-binding protein [Lawsonibacter celer]
MELETQVRELIAAACGTREALEPGTDLLERGLLDSLGLITLLEDLEDLGIEIQPTQVPREAFRTVDGILALCREAAGTG